MPARCRSVPGAPSALPRAHSWRSNMTAHLESNRGFRRRIPAPLILGMLLFLASRASGDTQTFTSGWDVWVARDATSLDCAGPYSFRTGCPDIVLARYGSLRNGRTYIALDFDTTPLPDNAVIDQVSLSLFVRNLDEEATDGAPPPPLNCGDIVPGAGNLNTLQVGIFWRGVPSLGYAGSDPNFVVT